MPEMDRHNTKARKISRRMFMDDFSRGVYRKCQEFGLLKQQPLSSESFCALSLWEKGLGEGVYVKPNETSTTTNRCSSIPLSKPLPNGRGSLCSRLRTKF